MTRRHLASLAALAAAGALVLTGCTGSSSGNAADRRTSNSILRQYEISQPVPKFPWSQIRQTAIDVETAQARTTQTTTFFFNQGVADPVQSCPSIGFPVASTTQITNPLTPTGYQDSSTVAQIDPNGIYSGDSSGTYVLCVGGAGKTYGVYWEGFVYAVTGPATFDRSTHDVKMTGPSSFDFKTK
jgi:hypothetical protein